MRDRTIDRIKTLFRSNQELAELLPVEALSQKLISHSNTIGEQFWCLVGARESYSKALIENGWIGFSCSLTRNDLVDKEMITNTLDKTFQEFKNLLSALEWTSVREDLLLDLYEHEAQHQGQLMRYVYGLNYKFPVSWSKRWALGE